MEPEKTTDSACTDDLVDLNASDLRNRNISDSTDSSNSRDRNNSKNFSDSRDNSLTDDFSDEESICRSPTKSPKKAVRKLLQRKDLAVLSVSPDGATVACGSDPGVQANLLPTDADFQFKEPKFRKKKFIFHPFTRAADNSCVPDPEKVNAGVSSFISIYVSDPGSVFSRRKRQSSGST
jgi:hypothetical protein